jgi:BMFP domain-containing protein YqiC
MIGMFTAQGNRNRLAELEAKIARLERKPNRSEWDEHELDAFRESRDDLAQWLDDLARIEG